MKWNLPSLCDSKRAKIIKFSVSQFLTDVWPLCLSCNAITCYLWNRYFCEQKRDEKKNAAKVHKCLSEATMILTVNAK